MNTFYTETFQKISKKSKSYDNTGKPSFAERKGAASSNKEISCKQACKQSYKHARSMKREWREE